jgi:hypothetical protein
MEAMKHPLFSPLDDATSEYHSDVGRRCIPDDLMALRFQDTPGDGGIALVG